MEFRQTHLYTFYLDKVFIDYDLGHEETRFHFYFDIYYAEYKPAYYAITYAALTIKLAEGHEIFAYMKFVLTTYLELSRFKEVLLNPLLSFLYDKLRDAGLDVYRFIFIASDPVYHKIENDVIPFDEFTEYELWQKLQIEYVYPKGESYLARKAIKKA